MSRLTLYNRWRSSCSHRVRIALAMKGLDYEYVPVPLAEDDAPRATLAARSPTGFVPCLMIDGVAYVESVAIIELLEELFPAFPLYPKDPHGRARVRALVEIVNSGIQPFQNSSVGAHVSGLVRGPDAARDWARRYNERGLRSLERAMEMGEAEGICGPYAYGRAPTAADVFLVPQVVSAMRFDVDIEPYRRVRASFDAAMALDPFRKAAPERQVDADVDADAMKA